MSTRVTSPRVTSRRSQPAGSIGVALRGFLVDDKPDASEKMFREGRTQVIFDSPDLIGQTRSDSFESQRLKAPSPGIRSRKV
jgi:hypothetical protein